MARWLLFSTIILLGACGEPDKASDDSQSWLDQNQEPEDANTSAFSGPNGLDDRFNEAQHVARTIMGQRKNTLYADPNLEKQFSFFKSYFEAGTTDLADCGSFSSFGSQPQSTDENDADRLTSGETQSRQIEELATYSEITRSFLNRLGYSNQVINQPLEGYIQSMLKEMRDSNGAYLGTETRDQYQQKLAETMNILRLEYQPDMPQIIWEGGCGAFDEPFDIVFKPDNGVGWIIGKFDFELCRFRKQDPWNVNGNCRGWEEISDGDRMRLSGNYIYQASWPNGKKRKGTKSAVADELSETNVITLRAP
ncbi:hypothetical protein [Parasphingorhabdus halotolerans]|uniref:Uncharacterized protein n=1 Tax=Parasphingorhabdus halotolerans TaxID=2725558 RepID=A0A6H2DPX2_9SPHN|nr:hypothetical protein [Parasphingorhabdus halotolerans]QJB70248.1 hypothetical protein HF685_13990 [Parasphingorhabdus halotolerans]